MAEKILAFLLAISCAVAGLFARLFFLVTAVNYILLNSIKTFGLWDAFWVIILYRVVFTSMPYDDDEFKKMDALEKCLKIAVLNFLRLLFTLFMFLIFYGIYMR